MHSVYYRRSDETSSSTMCTIQMVNTIYDIYVYNPRIERVKEKKINMMLAIELHIMY